MNLYHPYLKSSVLFFVLFLCTYSLSVQAQIINTIAGNGVNAWTGDGGLATAAEVERPSAIAIDGSGNVYINSGYRIRKIDASGVITTIAGTGTNGNSGDGGPATAAQISGQFIAADHSGNIFLSSFTNIREISSSGIITSIAGNPGIPGFSGDGGPASAALLGGPGAIAIDGSGNIYFTDGGNYRIRKISTSGVISTIAGTGGYGSSGDGGPATAATFSYIWGVAADAAGNVYLGDYDNDKIRKISTSGIMSTVGGIGPIGIIKNGVPATTSSIIYPRSVTVDGAGNIYLNEDSEDIREISASGIITAFASDFSSGGFAGDGGPATAAKFNNIQDIQATPNGDVYVADANNFRVRKIHKYYPPHFAGGDSQSLYVCENSVPDSINTLLAVIDTETGETLTWSTVSAPGHGSLISAYVTGSTGGTVTPRGLSYTPSAGYSGPDTFKVQVTDGQTADTTTIYVTINPISPISGAKTLCIGLPTTLSDTAIGGVWSSPAFSGIVSVSSATGIVSGIIPGTASITYTIGTGCAVTTAVTVDPALLPITGIIHVCTGNTSALTDIGGGSWSSSNTTVATVAPAGVVTGLSNGTSTITYKVPTGCYITATFIVSAVPTTITGASSLCVGNSANLSDAITGGSWSSSSTAVATAGSLSGLVSGISAGTVTITYTSGGICSITKTMTVNPAASVISGPNSVCRGDSVALSDGTGGGVWSSGNTVVAIIGTMGMVNGLSAGKDTIYYTLSTGCNAAKIVSVNPLSQITGGTSVCVGATITVSDSVSGGVWSAVGGAASIGSATGIVTGITLGTATIAYTLSTGCVATTTIAVSPSPTSVIGSSFVCVGSTNVLSDAVGGGTWTSSSTAVSVGLSTGIISGITAGSATITYSLGSGCTVMKTLTVNTGPSVITGASVTCIGGTIVLSDATTGGTWTSDATSVATVSVGVVSGITTGIANISYTTGSGCSSVKSITVTPLPSTITGGPYVCAGSAIALTDATPGGTWSSPGYAGIVSVGFSTGVVTGIAQGSATITYSLGVGCTASTTITVYPLPAAISGTAKMCEGSVTTLSDGGGGVWSSDNSLTATISGTGVVSGVLQGTATISYTLSSGCAATKVVTVNPLPYAIAGHAGGEICIGAVTVLSDAGGGTWSRTGSSLTIGITTGVVTGISVGSATVTYTLATGCAVTTTLTVIPPPSKITGPSKVCGSLSITLSDSTSGGAWISPGYAGIVAVGSGTGIVTGLSGGIAVITYSTGAGCMATKVVTVNPAVPAITGVTDMCANTKKYVYDADTPYGVWTSTFVTITPAGLVTASNPGAGIITYSMPTGCLTTASLTVNPLPAQITGSKEVCNSLSITLSDTTYGGAWSSSNRAIAVAGISTGIITGMSAGTVTISYILPTTGCYLMDTIIVDPLPSVITGAPSLCNRTTITLTDTLAGGMWSSPSGIVSVGGGSGAVTGLTIGTAVISYTSGSGCSVTKIVTVMPLPVAYAVSGGGSYCAGGVGFNILLSGSETGINYELYDGLTKSDSIAGTGLHLAYGPEKLAGVYKIVAVNAITGCSSGMSDSAVIVVNPTVIPSVTMSDGVSDTVCPGTKVTFVALPVNGGGTPVYQWTLDGLSVGAGGNTYSFVPTDGDVIVVTMISNAVCTVPAAADTFASLSVIMPVVPIFSISADPGTSIGKGQSVTFTATVTNGVPSLSYQWNINGVDLTGETNASYATSSLANYDAVSCRVTSSIGSCSAFGTDVVKVIVNDVGVNAVTAQGAVRLWPNPVKDELTIENGRNCEIKMFDLPGQRVFSAAVVSDKEVLHFGFLAPGIYIVQITDVNGVVQNVRLVKE